MRPFFIAVVCSWIALFVAARLYSGQHPQSYWIMSAALPAFLLESTFYLAAGFQATRDWFARIRPVRLQAWLLWISAILPYIVFSFGTETFLRNGLYVVAGLTAVLAFWWAIFPRRLAYDVGFLFLTAAPIVLKVFTRIYRSPDTHLQLDILGHLMWIRLGVVALLVLREWDPGAFGFWPTTAEWKSGALCFLIVILPVAAVALGIHDVQFVPVHSETWRTAAVALGTFFGILWVVALGEELFFRGVIEQAMLRGWRSPILATALSSVLYGGSHLWFHQYPNWRRAITATVLGLAFGVAYARTRSVRVPMVAHAFVVTTWRVFFK